MYTMCDPWDVNSELQTLKLRNKKVLCDAEVKAMLSFSRKIKHIFIKKNKIDFPV
jgi:hypothetical protein